MKKYNKNERIRKKLEKNMSEEDKKTQQNNTSKDT